MKLQFNLTPEEANMVIASLLELPAKNSMALIQNLQQQAAPQLTPPLDTTEKKNG